MEIIKFLESNLINLNYKFVLISKGYTNLFNQLLKAKISKIKIMNENNEVIALKFRANEFYKYVENEKIKFSLLDFIC